MEKHDKNKDVQDDVQLHILHHQILRRNIFQEYFLFILIPFCYKYDPSLNDNQGDFVLYN